MAFSRSLLGTLTICFMATTIMVDPGVAARRLEETLATFPGGFSVHLPDFSSISSAIAAFFPQLHPPTNPTLSTNPTIANHQQVATTTKP